MTKSGPRKQFGSTDGILAHEIADFCRFLNAHNVRWQLMNRTCRIVSGGTSTVPKLELRSIEKLAGRMSEYPPFAQLPRRG
jgi:hypothetical protein